MSFDAMRWAMKQDLPASQKMLLVTLADMTNKNTGRCNPSKQTIAKKAGMSARSVDDNLLKLRGRGLINFESSRGWKSNEYRLQTLQELHGINNTPQEMQRITPQQLQGIEAENPANGAENPANGAEYPAAAAPKPVITKKEPGKKGNQPAAVAGDTSPPCPHEEIIDLYHRHLPMCPTVEIGHPTASILACQMATRKRNAEPRLVGEILQICR